MRDLINTQCNRGVVLQLLRNIKQFPTLDEWNKKSATGSRSSHPCKIKTMLSLLFTSTVHVPRLAQNGMALVESTITGPIEVAVRTRAREYDKEDEILFDLLSFPGWLKTFENSSVLASTPRGGELPAINTSLATYQTTSLAGLAARRLRFLAMSCAMGHSWTAVHEL